MSSSHYLIFCQSNPKHINPCKHGRMYQTYFVPSLVLINVVPSQWWVYYWAYWVYLDTMPQFIKHKPIDISSCCQVASHRQSHPEQPEPKPLSQPPSLQLMASHRQSNPEHPEPKPLSQLPNLQLAAGSVWFELVESSIGTPRSRS